MTDMIYRVARAIYHAEWDADEYPWESDGDHLTSLAQARAALKAIEAPTPEMIEAGKTKLGMISSYSVDLDKVWRAMHSAIG